MGRRVTAALTALLAVMVIGAFGSASISGQAQWTMSRTPDGQPDLQGTWLNFDSTPFEQGPRMRRPDEAERAAGIGGPGWDATTPKTAAPRASMVVDPPNGRVPVLPWAEAKRDNDLAHIQDSWVYQTPWERCITRGIPGGIFPAAYNSAYQIVQGPGYVAILYEMIHNARIIPVDGSPHLPARIRLWDGDPRGRWEGNTLVVETTNYSDKGTIATNMASNRIRGIPQSEDLRVVERFTRVAADRIDYEVTITDPKVYTAPWKVAMPLKRDDSYQIYEYACHEGNIAMMATLAGGRAAERAGSAAPAPKPAPPAAAPSSAAAAAPSTATAHPGKVPYDRVCGVCHGPNGRGDAAPRLVPFGQDYQEVLGIVREGYHEMPPISERRLSDDELQQIVTYLKSLTP
jgi:mono/diheme cytochrome c family protein